MGFIYMKYINGYYGFDDDGNLIKLEVCDVCNNPRPDYELTNVGGQTDHDAIWECNNCHGVNKS